MYCALSAIIQFDDVDYIARFPGFLLFLYADNLFKNIAQNIMALKLIRFHDNLNNKYMADNPRDYLPSELLYSNRQLLKLGKFLSALKHIYLNFIGKMSLFYLNYTFYSGLLIFC